MALILFREDPTGALGQDITQWSGSITEYLMTKQSVDPDYIVIELNGIDIPVDTESPDMRLLKPLSELDRVNIYNQPKGFDPFTAIIVAVAAALAVTLLMPSINPNNMGTMKESPNNNLNAQTNQARRYQAIPDILGEPVPYPDLTGEATQEYVQKERGQAQKVVTQLMSVSVETYQVDEVYTSDTKLSQIGGTYTVFNPVNKRCIVPLVQETFSINEVDGQELFAPDQVESQLVIVTPAIANSGTIVQVDSDSYTITTTLDVSELSNIQSFPVNCDFEIDFVAIGGGATSQKFKAILQTYEDVTGTYTLGIKTDDVVTLTNNITKMKITADEKTAIGPFTTPVNGDHLWIDFTFPRGLKGKSEIRVDYEMKTDTQTVEDSKVYVFEKDSLDQQFYTEKLTSTIGECEWTVTLVRINDAGNTSESPTMTKIERIASIRTTSNKNFGNVTLIEVKIPATLQATSLRENKVNLRGGRMVIGYNRTTGQVDYTLRRSRVGADLLLHEYVMVFGKSPDDLDLVTLYDIYDNLSDPRLGYFDFTFDDLDVSLGSRMQTILNAARIFAIPIGSQYTFRRDEKQDYASTILTRRDIAANRQYKYTYKPQMQSDKDSVRVEFVDPDTNKKAFIERKYENGQFVSGVGANPVKIELPCIKEEFNAINRAELEIRKLFYLRETISDTFIASNSVLIQQGELIGYEEVYNDACIGGEITAVNGNQLRLSEDIPDLDNLYIEYTNNKGQKVGPYPIVKTGAKNCTVTNSSGAYASNRDYAKGSMYLISTLQGLGELEYIANQIKPSSDGKTVQITMTKNDNRVFEFDGV